MIRRLAGLAATVFVVVVLASAHPTAVFAVSPQDPPPAPPSTVVDPRATDTVAPAPVPVPTMPAAAGVEAKPPAGESLIPDAGASPYPTRNYDIGYDEGAWNNFSRKTLGFFTGLGFLINRMMVGVVLWLVGWAFRFDVVGPLAGPILTIANVFNTQIVAGLQLGHFVWFAVIAYVGFQFFRGRATAGVGELLMSIAALAVTVVISANPAGYLDGAVNTLRQTSGAVLSLARGVPPSDDPGQAAQLVDPLRAELHHVLIEEPHEIIDWGRPLTGTCKQAADQLVADGPWGVSDKPRDVMSAAGCRPEVAFNHDPSFERMASAWMAAIVSAIVMILLLLTVVTMLLASLFFILRFTWLHVALLGFQAPGAARELAWGWIVGLFKQFGIVAAMSFVISYLMIGASAFLNAPGLGLAERFAVLIVMAVAMFIYRKQMLAGIAHLADRLRGELGSLRPGSRQRAAGGWSRPGGQASGLTGYGIGQRAREAVIDVPGTRAYNAGHAGRRLQYGDGQRRSAGTRAQRSFQQRLVADDVAAA